MKTLVTFAGSVSFVKTTDLTAEEIPSPGEPVRVQHPETGELHNGYVESVEYYAADAESIIRVQEA